MTQANGSAAAQPDQPSAPQEASEGVQSQGSTADVEGLFSRVLGAIPEHLREAVEPHLKEWNGNVNRKFQENADYRKQWEPFEELGLSDVGPETLKELLQFRELAQDEEKFGDWLLREAESRELLDPDDDGEGGEGSDEGFDPYNPESFKSMFSELIDGTLEKRLGPIEQRFSSMDEETRKSEADKVIGSTLEELEGKHGKFDQEAVMKLSLAHAKDGTIGAEAIQAGFADYQGIAGSAESGLFEQKAQQPQTAEQGGRTPSPAQKPPTTFKDAREAAVEMARQSTAAN